jgi:hypothetical protein
MTGYSQIWLKAAVHPVLLAVMPLMWMHQGQNLYQVMLPLMQPQNRVMTQLMYQGTTVTNQSDHLDHQNQLALGHHTLGIESHSMTKVKVPNGGLIGPGSK